MTTFISGTLTSSNPGADIAAAMATPLAAEGFTLVDTVVIGTNTHKVWEMLAANNSLGYKWYLDIMYPTTGAGSYYLRVFEAYDPTTHLAKRGTHDMPNASPFGTPYYAYYQDSAFALETNWRVGEAIGAASSSYGYWISISSERVVLLNSTQPTVAFYSGLFTPHPLYTASAGAYAYPLIQSQIGPSGSVSGCLTRFPRISAAGATSYYWYQHLSYSGRVHTFLPTVPFTSSFSFANAFVSPIRLLGGGNTPVSYWGYLIDVGIVGTNGTIARGDTITVETDVWVLGTNDSGYAIAFAKEE